MSNMKKFIVIQNVEVYMILLNFFMPQNLFETECGIDDKSVEEDGRYID
jgi:hypothetical protein